MEKKPKLLGILDWVTLVLFIAATIRVFFFTPIEAVMGVVQKVFYFHVSAGWVGMLGFLAAAVTGGFYLKTRNHKWDIASEAAVEIGMVFMLINIITGAIWARPIWNAWWTWDPRLTTSTVMELIYAAYLMLRKGVEEPDNRARFGAVYAIVGFISVPLTFFSIRIFRTIHPVIIGNGDSTASGAFSMSPAMSLTFSFSLIVFTLVFIDLIWHRIRLGRLADTVEQMKLKEL